MKITWKDIDDFLGKVGNLILIIIILVSLYFILRKPLIGEYMMYNDYYEQHKNKQ